MNITVKRLRLIEKELGWIDCVYTDNNKDEDIDVIVVAYDSSGVLKYSKNKYGWTAYLEYWTYSDRYHRIDVKVCNNIEDIIKQIWWTKNIITKLPIKLERKLKLKEINEGRR